MRASTGSDAAARPWVALYPPGVEADVDPVAPSMLHAWRGSVERHAQAPAAHYLDRSLTFADIDAVSDALAAALIDVADAGDRLGIYLQNDPQWLVGMLAAWKAGLVPVALNPMLKARELRHHLDDARVGVLLCLASLYDEVVAGALGGSTVRQVFTTTALDLWTAGRADSPVETSSSFTVVPLAAVLIDYRGARPPAHEPGPHDVALLTYTSGTTGAAKAAMNLHRGMVHSSQVYRDWFDLRHDDTILGMAPLFHITGSVAGMGVTILTGAPLVLDHRFDAARTLGLIERWQCTFSVGTVTAYIALANDPSVPNHDLSSLTKAGCGGAAISPSTVARVEELAGLRIRPIYGLTETTSPTHLTPPGCDPPIDLASGALAVGLPVPGARVRIVDITSGDDLDPGSPGEIVVSGPMVVPGYWEQPEATAHAIRDGWLHTGDVGTIDEEGWLFVVDRVKDLINAGGYKVWPREVEDVLYEHPSVREAAVVGVPDAYRGETVRAVVSLVPGSETSGDELIAFCRERMAAYKYPRQVEIRDQLPKTASGKLLRRELRGG